MTLPFKRLLGKNKVIKLIICFFKRVRSGFDLGDCTIGSFEGFCLKSSVLILPGKVSKEITFSFFLHALLYMHIAQRITTYGICIGLLAFVQSLVQLSFSPMVHKLQGGQGFDKWSINHLGQSNVSLGMYCVG